MIHHLRIIYNPTISGEKALVMDEVLLDSISNSSDIAIFKISGFSEETITIGRFTNISEEINTYYCRKKGLKILKRISGGGSSLHCNKYELTFSYIAPLSAGKKLELSGTYQHYLYPIIVLLKKRYNIDVKINKFGDIIYKKRKISGSAQYRTNNGIICHGYILFGKKGEYICNILKKSREKIKKKGLEYPTWAITLEEITGKKYHFLNIADEIIKILKEKYDCTLTQLYPAEKKRLEEKIKRYNSPEWRTIL